MKTLIGILLSTALSTAQGLSGQYRAELGSPGGGSLTLTGFLALEGKTVSGRFGPTAMKMVPISDGLFEKDELSFVLAPLDRSRFVLRKRGDAFEGEVAAGTGLKSPFKTIRLTRQGPLSLSDQVDPLPNEGEDRSPRLLELRYQLLKRQGQLLTEFWQEMAKVGTPLIEEADNTSTKLVTFLWRGRPQDRNVLVLWSPFAFQQPGRFFMLRVPETDVWFLTLRLPLGTRFGYRFSPNDPLATNPPGAEPRQAVNDPLNPSGRVVAAQSVSPVEDNPPQADAVRLAVTEHTVRSEALGQDRKVLVYFPVGRPPRDLPSLYLLDGEDRDGTVFSTAAIESLITRTRISPLVIVRIVNPIRQRDKPSWHATSRSFVFWPMS